MTREEWLQEAVGTYREHFHQSGHEVPQVHVSVGWAFQGARKRRGECWAGAASADGVSHIFIAPTVSQVQALVTLAHELVHAVDGCVNGHRAPFVRIARSIGLEEDEKGGFTSACSGPELIEVVERIIKVQGPYPHATLNPGDGKAKKQATYQLKAACLCGYTIRLTQKWADLGLPDCPACGGNIELEVK